MRTLLLIVHVAAGTTGLLVGPVAMLAPKRRGRHTTAGRIYQAATAALCTTAVALAALRPTLWWLGAIGIATEAAALGGWLVRTRRRPGWLPVHISLMCGSYISFVTAFLVVNSGLGFWPAWIAPTLLGTPFIARASRRHALNRTAGSPLDDHHPASHATLA